VIEESIKEYGTIEFLGENVSIVVRSIWEFDEI
jgi:hypothetical protein